MLYTFFKRRKKHIKRCGTLDPLSTQSSLDDATDDWGIKVERVEIKDVKLPLQLQRAMAAEAEASREARAKVRQFKGAIRLIGSWLLIDDEYAAKHMQWGKNHIALQDMYLV